MNKAEFTSNVEDTIVACPACRVCAFKLSEHDTAELKAGQLMFDVCPVCNNTVILDG